jgi:hypothetical protein
MGPTELDDDDDDAEALVDDLEGTGGNEPDGAADREGEAAALSDPAPMQEDSARPALRAAPAVKARWGTRRPVKLKPKART